MRALVLWCVDWPVVAAAGQVPDVDPAAMPVAVLTANRVVACSAMARVEGVRRGQRKREAQARCPGLVALPRDESAEARAYEPVVAAVEALAPGVEVTRPGLCAVRAQGPTRFFGGEEAAAARLAGTVMALGVECQAGVADGVFAATLAARQDYADPGGRPPETPRNIIPVGRAPEFLAPFPVDVLDRPELADLLRRLGIRTLGAFAALPAREVLIRFGPDGALAHRLAGGADDRQVAVRRPPSDLAVRHELDPPVNRVDTAAFHAKAAAEQFVSALTERGLVCSSIDISAQTHAGEWLSRRWRHDGALTAGDIADRMRWQVESWLVGATLRGEVTGSDEGYERPHGIIVLRLEPVEAMPAGAFPTALWGGPGEHDERARRAVNRVHSLLGHAGVLVPVCAGGRGPGDAIEMVPWGDQRIPSRPAEPPWPGRLPAPSPAVVLPRRRPVTVLDATGAPVQVSGRAAISAPPVTIAINGDPPEDVLGWAGPWPVDERWWDPRYARRCARVQISTASGAWLLAVEDNRWWLTATYG